MFIHNLELDWMKTNIAIQRPSLTSHNKVLSSHFVNGTLTTYDKRNSLCDADGSGRARSLMSICTNRRRRNGPRIKGCIAENASLALVICFWSLFFSFARGSFISFTFWIWLPRSCFALFWGCYSFEVVFVLRCKVPIRIAVIRHYSSLKWYSDF